MELRFSSALWGLILFSDCYEIEFCNLMLVNHWPDSSLPGIGFILATFEFRLWSSDLAANSAAKNVDSGSSANSTVGGAPIAGAQSRSTYVPPNLRHLPQSSDPPASEYNALAGND